jgi:hypothetical protein
MPILGEKLARRACEKGVSCETDLGTARRASKERRGEGKTPTECDRGGIVGIVHQVSGVKDGGKICHKSSVERVWPQMDR